MPQEVVDSNPMCPRAEIRAWAALQSLMASSYSQDLLRHTIASWRQLIEEVRRERAGALFDAMGNHLRTARAQRDAADRRVTSLLRGVDSLEHMTVSAIVLHAWGRAVLCKRLRQGSIDAISSASQRTCDAQNSSLITRTFLSWRVAYGCPSHSVAEESAQHQPQVTRPSTERSNTPSPVECARGALQRAPSKPRLPAGAFSSECSTHAMAVLAPDLLSAEVGQASDVALPVRQPLVERNGNNGNAHAIAKVGGVLPASAEPKRVKGPERFFYETGGYTGCARYGGPSIVQKENVPFTAVAERRLCRQGSVHASTSRKAPPVQSPRVIMSSDTMPVASPRLRELCTGSTTTSQDDERRPPL